MQNMKKNIYSCIKSYNTQYFTKRTVHNSTKPNEKSWEASFEVSFLIVIQEGLYHWENTCFFSATGKNSWNNTQKTIWCQAKMHSFGSKCCGKMQKKHCLFLRCEGVSFLWSWRLSSWFRNLLENRFFRVSSPSLAWSFFQILGSWSEWLQVETRVIIDGEILWDSCWHKIKKMYICSQLVSLLILPWNFTSQQNSGESSFPKARGYFVSWCIITNCTLLSSDVALPCCLSPKQTGYDSCEPQRVHFGVTGPPAPHSFLYHWEP